MNVFLIGSGGREHALAWALSRSPSVTRVFASPGNPGIALHAEIVAGVDATSLGYLHAAEALGAALTVVGPEAPLVAGIVDVFRARGFAIVGPTQANARLEGSKVFAKRFFRDSGIPTAQFHIVATLGEAEDILDRSSFPLVVKTDGLAAGKGVIIAQNRAEADQAINTLGLPLVIEDFLTGEEVSFIVLADGRHILPLEPCQDHKAAYDGDRGPNTGGMGAYCDSRILTASERATILDTIIRPTVDATGFTGFLFAGLIMTAHGPKLLEYNVRLGDPETQPILHRLQTDLGEVLLASAQARLSTIELAWRPEPSICVVLASAGYPGTPQTGDLISGIAEAEAAGATVFHAGTKLIDGHLETAGGRVLGVTARGETLKSATDRAYEAASRIHFSGMQYRRDIGAKGLSRWRVPPLQ